MASTSTSNLDFSRTFEMDYALKKGVFHFEVPTLLQDSGAILRGTRSLPGGAVFRAMKGTRSADLMGTTRVAIRIASQRLVDILDDAGFTGWRTEPVLLQDNHGQEVPGRFHALVITGRAGPIDPSRSEIVLEPPPVPRGEPTYAEVGLYFDPASWDGSDLFLPESTSAICAVERVKGVIEQSPLSNVQFTRLDQFQGGRYSSAPPGRRVRFKTD
jgi:hypothetical protein